MESQIANFRRHVVKTEDCWLWTAYRDELGYGRFNYMLAHRFSYEFYKGSIPKGLLVLHSCDNPSCVNPEHLSTGTHQDNMDDKMRKNRHPKRLGIRVEFCKNGHELTPENSRSNQATRQCRICHNARKRLLRAKKKQELAD